MTVNPPFTEFYTRFVNLYCYIHYILEGLVNPHELHADGMVFHICYLQHINNVLLPLPCLFLLLPCLSKATQAFLVDGPTSCSSSLSGTTHHFCPHV